MEIRRITNEGLPAALDLVWNVIATRNEGNHIALFFVRTEYQGQRIGRTLFEHVVPLSDSGFLAVNSSPYAAKIYRKLSLTDTASEQITNGIRYISMKHTVGRYDG